MKVNMKSKLILFSLILFIALAATQACFAQDIDSDLACDNSGSVGSDLACSNFESIDSDLACKELNKDESSLKEGETREDGWFIGESAYDTLESAVANANDGDIIEGIASNYTITSPIYIDKTLTIQSLAADAPVLSGNKSNSIFSIGTNGRLTLKNLVLINGYSDDDGGAISNNGSLIILNSTFTANIAYNSGGAIFSNGSLIIENSFFNKNRVNYGNGGVISTEDGTLSVNNSEFVENYDAFNGGAIAISSTNAIINNTNFTDNYAGNMAGAIFIGGESVIEIENSFVKSNTGKIYAGAISNFYGCNLTIRNSTFDSNQEPMHYAGGVIYNGYNAMATIIDSKFINNLAGSGGAIKNDYCANMIIINSLFDNNTAYSLDYASYGTGGAISNTGNLIINGSNFTNNMALDGGAICNYISDDVMGNLTLNDCTFDSNRVSDTSAAIYNQEALLTINNSTFKNMEACFGAAIVSFDGILNINGSMFLNCSGNNLTTNDDYKNLAGAIALMKSYYSYQNSITNNRFINCSASKAGAIYSLAKLVLVSNEFINISSDNETLVLQDIVEIANNSFQNASIGFKISSDNLQLDFGQLAEIEIGLLYPNYYDGDLLNKTSFTIYDNDNPISGNASVKYAFIPEDRGTNYVYALANISSKATNVLEFEIEKYDDFLAFNYTSQGNTAYFVTNITDENGNIVKVGNLSYQVFNSTGDLIDEITVYYTDNEGFIYSKDYEIGLYNLSIRYQDRQYKNILNNTRFLIGKLTSHITASYVWDEDDVIITGLISPNDASGNITLALDGVNLTNSLLDRNQTSFTLSDLSEGVYNFTLTYGGDDIYDKSSDTIIITVNARDEPDVPIDDGNGTSDDEAILISNDLLMEYKDGSKFTITLLKGDKALAGEKIAFTISNKTYYRFTNENGSASLAINLLPKNYAITTTAPNLNLSVNNSISVNNWDSNKLSIEVSNLTMDYSDNGTYLVTVKYDNKPVSGIKLGIKLCSKTYNRTTDENGQARLAIRLSPASYNAIVTVKVADISKVASSRILVNKMKVHFSNPSKSVKTSNYFKVSLLDKNNKAVPSQKISIVINSKTYQVKTNSNGIASLKISLAKGTYGISYSLLSNGYYENKNTKVTSTLKVTA